MKISVLQHCVANNTEQFIEKHHMWFNNILQVTTIVKTKKLVQASLTKTYNVTYEYLTAAETGQVSVQIFMTKLEGLHMQNSLRWIELYWIHCQKMKVTILTIMSTPR